MKGVQCYELFGGIALKNHTFSFHFHFITKIVQKVQCNVLHSEYISLQIRLICRAGKKSFGNSGCAEGQVEQQPRGVTPHGSQNGIHG